MIVEDIAIQPCEMPLEDKDWKFALASVSSARGFVVAIRADSGHIGYGYAPAIPHMGSTFDMLPQGAGAVQADRPRQGPVRYRSHPAASSTRRWSAPIRPRARSIARCTTSRRARSACRSTSSSAARSATRFRCCASWRSRRRTRRRRSPRNCSSRATAISRSRCTATSTRMSPA